MGVLQAWWIDQALLMQCRVDSPSWGHGNVRDTKKGFLVAKDPLEKFENESRLLSDDEQELIRVLASFNEALQALRAKVAELEATVAVITGGMLIVNQRKDD